MPKHYSLPLAIKRSLIGIAVGMAMLVADKRFNLGLNVVALTLISSASAALAVDGHAARKNHVDKTDPKPEKE